MPNRQSAINDNAINRLPQIECNVLLDEFPTVTDLAKPQIQFLPRSIKLEDVYQDRVVSLHVDGEGYFT